ncbi:MAG: LysM domain-containing protein [bacterium]|nr:LysM domain-containing protein [bacterium]
MSNDLDWNNLQKPIDDIVDEMFGVEKDSKFYFGDYVETGKFSSDLYEPVAIDSSINVSLADINNLNIVINDDECSNFLIEMICQKLDADGIKYSFTSQSENLDVADAVVITFDQQYIAGPKVSIIGAYSNDRSDNSDVLALAMDTAFRANGVDCAGIVCGRRGYRQDEEGISTRIPTPTEDAIPYDTNTSFVTISFGTNALSGDDIANIIEEGFGRYVAYINTDDKKGDLIYRAQKNDTLESLAEKFGTTAFDVSKLNNLDNIIPDDEAIINPVKYNSVAFSASVPLKINEIENKRSLK